MQGSAEISNLDSVKRMLQSAPELWAVVGHVLERVVSHVELGRRQSQTQGSWPSLKTPPPSHFHATKVPNISVPQYVARIQQFADCSESCVVVAFIYIDRLLQKNPQFVLSAQSIHRLLITAVLLAIKFSEDRYYDNVFYAKIGGVSLSELNVLESDMLFLLQFDLYVHPQTYLQYVHNLHTHLTPPVPGPGPGPVHGPGSLRPPSTLSTSTSASAPAAPSTSTATVGAPSASASTLSSAPVQRVPTPEAIPMDCSSVSPKPLEKIDSMNSMHTVPSSNDLSE